ncbi:hypothetical protein AKJ18_16945 [Vibrio xuii]|nr:hypothetical protein AKJ18_16945 [Vibrio xuii]
MKPKFLLISIFGLGLFGCNGGEGTSSSSSPTSPTSPTKKIQFTEQVYYALPGEKISVGINSQYSSSSLRALSQTLNTATQIDKIVVDGVEYRDIDNVYAPDYLGDFAIVAYDNSGYEIASSTVNTDISLVNLEFRNTSDTIAMDGGIANYQAIGTFDVGGVLVSRDISTSVDWDVSGSIKPLNGVSNAFYFDGTEDASLSIRYGELSQQMSTKVEAPISVNSRTITVGGVNVISDQTFKLPGQGIVDLNAKVHYEDARTATDSTIVWQLSAPQSGVSLNGNSLNIQEDNLNFTLNAYSTEVVNGNVQLSANPVMSIAVEVGSVDMSLANVELQLERATYRIGDKLKFRVYKNFNSGLRTEVADPSLITIHGEMIDSNSLGEASITEAISGEVYAKVFGVDETSNSVAISVASESIESLRLSAHDSNIDNYLVGGIGYPFNIYSQDENGMNEPCDTCKVVITNSAGEELGKESYAVEYNDPRYTLRLTFFQPDTYYVKAVTENSAVSSDVMTITVPNNPITSIAMNVNGTINTFLGGHITPTVTANYTDGQTGSVDSVSYSVTPSGFIDIQGDTLYPIQSGDIELTAYSNGMSVTRNVTLQVEENVSVQSGTIKFSWLSTNAVNELILDSYIKPSMELTLSNGSKLTYPYEDVSWSIKSSESPYEQTLQGFRFSHTEEYGEDTYTEFIGSIYFQGELYQTELKKTVDNLPTSGLWIAKYDWNKVDEIKVGQTVSFWIRRGYVSPSGAKHYSFLEDTQAAPSNNNIKVVASSEGATVQLQGQSAGPVRVDFYSQYGDYLDSEEFMIVE